MTQHLRPTILANTRPLDRGKGGLRSVRRAGLIPGSVYGHGETVSIQAGGKAVNEYLSAHSSGAVLDLDLDGLTTQVLLREVDRAGVTGAVLHVGFQRINLTEDIHASIPLRFEGEAALIRDGLVMQRLLDSVELRGRADLLPETLTVDMSQYQSGGTLTIGDIPLPSGVSLLKDGGVAAAVVSTPRAAANAVAEG